MLTHPQINQHIVSGGIGPAGFHRGDQRIAIEPVDIETGTAVTRTRPPRNSREGSLGEEFVAMSNHPCAVLT